MKLILLLAIATVPALAASSSLVTTFQDVAAAENTQAPAPAPAPADIFFFVDSSVWRPYFGMQLNFVKDFIMRLDLNVTKVGLAVFSNEYQPVLELDFHRDEEVLNRIIQNAKPSAFETDMERGLRDLRTRAFGTGSREKYVTKIGILITGKRFKYPVATIHEAKLARDDDIWIFAVGVGNEVDKTELSGIASKPTANYTFFLDSFKDLSHPLSQKLLAGTDKLRRQPPEDNGVCGRDTKADVVFVYNEAAMNFHHVMQVREFITDLANNLSMSLGTVRMGIISEGCTGQDLDLSKHIRRDDFVSALSHQPKPRLSHLLEKLRLRGFTESRHNADKVAVVFLDDVMVDKDKIKYEVRRLHDDVSVYVIAVGSTHDSSEARLLASSEGYVTELTSYDELGVLAHNITFLEKLCDLHSESLPDGKELSTVPSVVRPNNRGAGDRVGKAWNSNSSATLWSLRSESSDAAVLSHSVLSLMVVVLSIQSFG